MQKIPDAASLTPDHLVERWQVWLTETEKEAMHLFSSRFLFTNIRLMFVANEALQKEGGNSLFNWIHQNFYTEQLVCIRRELEKGGGHVTLMNFLFELEAHCEAVLTRERYVALYQDSVLKEHGFADKHFDEKHGAMCPYPRQDKGRDCISRESVRGVREQLDAGSEKVLKFANWFIAHRTRAKPVKISLQDIFAVVNHIFDVYARYYNIITASVWIGRYPVHQFDWTSPFRVPWMTNKFEPWKPPDD